MGRLLAADDNGSYVGWVDTDATPASEFVVYDTARHTEVVRTAAGNPPATGDVGEFDIPVMIAIDGQLAYWHSSAGITAFDLRTDTSTLIAPRANYLRLEDAEAGQLAQLSPDSQHTVISSDPGAKGQTFAGTWANLSPTARYVATDESDKVTVFEISSGRQVTPRHPDHPFIAVTSWLDDDRFVALGIAAGNDDSDPLDVLTCSVSSQQCQVAAAGVAPVTLALPIRRADRRLTRLRAKAGRRPVPLLSRPVGRRGQPFGR